MSMYVVEHSHSNGQIIVRCFDLEGLRQSQNCFVTDEDLFCLLLRECLTTYLFRPCHPPAKDVRVMVKRRLRFQSLLEERQCIQKYFQKSVPSDDDAIAHNFSQLTLQGKIQNALRYLSWQLY